MNLLLLTGLLIGAAYGYVAQRGAFCLNSGFRMVTTKRDFTKVKALGLAVAIQMIVVPAVFALGWAQPSFPPFFPVGAILGGLIFGVAMYFAAGCAAGVWFKSGAGSVGAVVAIVGMGIGATVFEMGPLQGVRDAIHGLGGGAVSFQPATSLGIPMAALTAPLGLAMIFLLWRTKITTAGAWTWRRTGLLLGLASTAAWPLAALADRFFGMAVIPGTVDTVRFLGGGDVSFKGGFGGWDILFLLGLPLGAFIAARRGNELKFSVPKPVSLAKMTFGGFGLGAGASLAAGCTVGHGLVGIPLLAPGSIVTLAAIFVGSTLTAVFEVRRKAVSARSTL
ncbi:MAG: YeeE/YedE family protein [Gammaproteobacteria bacterium]|nr:YeeE/YedE family protein [Gammaproteobacteria bacterium]